MKTNQNMVRKMDSYDVIQRTKDGYFDGNSLLRQWNSNPQNSQRKMEVFLEAHNTKEFIEALTQELSVTDCKSSSGQNSHELDIKLVSKSRVKEKGKAGRPVGQVWMHPYLFIKFAMWINPRFEVKVIKFVYDELVKCRNEAGDAYREMSAAIARIVDKTFFTSAIQDVAKALNYVVFNEHESDIRNKMADESKIRELLELEKDIVKLIHFGFITSFDQLKQHLRKLWSVKWQSKIFAA
jgi:hypothetical protein